MVQSSDSKITSFNAYDVNIFHGVWILRAELSNEREITVVKFICDWYHSQVPGILFD